MELFGGLGGGGGRGGGEGEGEEVRECIEEEGFKEEGGIGMGKKFLREDFNCFFL